MSTTPGLGIWVLRPMVGVKHEGVMEHKIITAVPVVTLLCQPPNNRSIQVDLQEGNIITLSVVDPPGQTGGHTEDGGKEAERMEAGWKFLFLQFMAVVCVVGVLVMFVELPLKRSLFFLLAVVMVLLLFF
ncbi:unnamed protein product [Oreochromis niloticus]|nr:unnamed protein product [Mustela putorius furo]